MNRIIDTTLVFVSGILLIFSFITSRSIYIAVMLTINSVYIWSLIIRKKEFVVYGFLQERPITVAITLLASTAFFWLLTLVNGHIRT